MFNAVDVIHIFDLNNLIMQWKYAPKTSALTSFVVIDSPIIKQAAKILLQILRQH